LNERDLDHVEQNAIHTDCQVFSAISHGCIGSIAAWRFFGGGIVWNQVL
jgi:hypothetical protein